MNAQKLKTPGFRTLLDKTLFAPKLAPYVLVLPFLVAFFVFFFYPFLSSIQMSTLKFHGLTSSEFVGFENFRLLINPRFLGTIRVTLTYTFWTIAILVPLPLFLAILINSKLCKASTFFKSAFFLPQLTSVIVAGMFFRFALSSTDTALLNTIVGYFGVEPVAWLRERTPAMVSMVLLCVWRWFGINLIYFLSSMQSISPDLYEAASIDGAGAWKRFIYVTLPGLKPTIVFVVAISVFGGFAMFSESFALFGSSRTPGDIASTMVGYIYAQAFVEGRLGMAAAAGMSLLALVMIINVIVLAVTGTFRKAD